MTLNLDLRLRCCGVTDQMFTYMTYLHTLYILLVDIISK